MYVMKCKLFGVCFVSKGAEKHILTLNGTFHIPINLDLNRRGFREGHKPLHLSNEPKISRQCHSFGTAP